MKLNLGCFLPDNFSEVDKCDLIEEQTSYSSQPVPALQSQQPLNVGHKAVSLQNFSSTPMQDNSSSGEMDTCISPSERSLAKPCLQLHKSASPNPNLDLQVAKISALKKTEQQCGGKHLFGKLEDTGSARLAEKIKYLGEILKNIDESQLKRANAGSKTVGLWPSYKRRSLETDFPVSTESVFDKTKGQRFKDILSDNHAGSLKREAESHGLNKSLAESIPEDTAMEYLRAEQPFGRTPRELPFEGPQVQTSTSLVNCTSRDYAFSETTNELQTQNIKCVQTSTDGCNPCSRRIPREEFRVQLDRIADSLNMNSPGLLGKMCSLDSKVVLQAPDVTKEMLMRLDNLEQMMKTKERSKGLKQKVKRYAASIEEHMARTDAAVQIVENKLQELVSSGNTTVSNAKEFDPSITERSKLAHENGQGQMEDQPDISKALNSKCRSKKLQKHVAGYQDIQNIACAAEEIHKHWSTLSTEIKLCWSAINQLCIDNEQFREELRQQKAFIHQHFPSGSISHWSQKSEKVGYLSEDCAHELSSHFLPSLLPQNPMQKVKKMKRLRRSFQKVHLKRYS